MQIGHVTKTGNVSLPKKWRAALGISPNSDILMVKKENQIIIEPLKKKSLKETFMTIDEEMAKKKISFSREEAIRDDLYDEAHYFSRRLYIFRASFC